MKPVLRAATVAMALAVSYGMLASAPAAADPAGTDGRLDLEYGKRLNRDPKLTPSTARPETPQNDPAANQPHATTVKAKPYDVNGDGYADAVVGAVGEDLGYDTDAGMLHVLYGRSGGITTSGDKVIHQDTYGVPGSPEDGDWFAYTNTSGDFNADGFADVAVSTIGEDIGTVEEAGLVQVFYGSATGLKTSNVTGLEVPRPWLSLGIALAAGDFNGDGRDDLAVGAPYRDAGSVFVYGGMDSGLSTTGKEFMQGADMPGTPLTGEGFGESLSTGDINGDGYYDLAIGAGWDADDTGSPIGSVTLLYGSASGLNTSSNAQRFSKETPGVPGDGGWFGDEEAPDFFGYDVELADFNGDGKADLAAGAPGAPVTYDGTRKPDAGTVTVLYSNGTQIGTDNAVEITEATPNIPGLPSDYDYLGLTLAGGDPNGDSKAELTTYSPGDGYVTVIPGSDAGLVTANAKGWTQ
ncbi:MAG TPA: FG-GAP repeat protein, partial [Micromonosporaceae bacterium]|nr:FG-GAP repeat protein [Micromonosporaceae bacterium]